MTHPEDLKRGDWIVVIRDKYWEKESYRPNEFGSMSYQENKPPTYTGYPCEVLAVAVPFLSIRRQGQQEALDLRQYDVRKVTEEYTRSFVVDTVETTKGFLQKEDKPVLLTGCPVCQSPLYHRMRGGVEYHECDECKFQGSRRK